MWPVYYKGCLIGVEWDRSWGFFYGAQESLRFLLTRFCLGLQGF
jgi:hypothetical protein